MEFRIVDILDTVDASDISVKPRKVASNRAIAQLVFDNLPSRTQPTHAPRRSVRMAALAAVLTLLISLSLMVGAAQLRVADLFGSFFGPLSQGQTDTLDGIRMIHGAELPVSADANGTTVTLQAAFGDDRFCYLKLLFQAPENQKLSVPDQSQGALEIVEREYYETPAYTGLLSTAQGERLHCYFDLTWVDPVPNDHQLALILELSLPVDSSVSFIDEEPEVLTISGLWSRTLSLEYTQVLEGPWVIELGRCTGQLRDLDVQGKTASYTAAGKTTTVLLDSIKMSQLGLEVKGTFTGSAEAVWGSYPTPMVVLKDGSVFPSHLFLGDKNDFGNGMLSSTDFLFSVKFDAPLDLAQVDHVRIGDLVVPFSKDSTLVVDSSTTPTDGYVLGTHIVLGDPNSLRSSGPIAKLEDIGVHGAGSITAENWRDAWLYAAHTEKGVQLTFINSDFVSGKLVYTITDADVITNLSDLKTKPDGFSYEACLELDSTNTWQHLDRPGCIRDDGTFEEGWYLVTLNITVKNDQAALRGKEPYRFNAQCLLTLADLRHKTVGNYRCQNIDYFSGLDDPSGRKLEFCLEPGEEASFTIGYLVRNPDFTALRACTTTGGERSTFVDLKLDEKAAD